MRISIRNDSYRSRLPFRLSHLVVNSAFYHLRFNDERMNERTNKRMNERFKKLSTTQTVRTYYFIRSSSTLRTLLYMRSLRTSLKSYLLIVLTISERTTAEHERRSEQHKTTAAISIIIDWCLSAYELYIYIFYQMSFQILILVFLELSS